MQMTALRQSCSFFTWAGSGGGIGGKRCSRGKNRTDGLGVQRGRLPPVATGGRQARASALGTKQSGPAEDSLMGVARPGRSYGVQLRLGAGKHAWPCVFTCVTQERRSCPCPDVHVLACVRLCAVFWLFQLHMHWHMYVPVCVLMDASNACRCVFLCAR